jgi:RNA polymerase sigma-70 factor (ECF subfamily)
MTGSAGSAGPGTADRPDPSDLELLRAHVGGDPHAFAELLRRHRDRLWAVALRTIGDREDAADALQDALLSAHRAAPRFRGDSAVTTWLHRIVVNACLDRIRRRQAHPTVPLPDGSRSDEPGRWTGGVEPSAPLHDHDTVLVVRDGLARLPTDQRTALILVDVEGYSVADVATMLGVAEGTVKSRCFRGRARLATILGHLRPTPAAGIPAPARSTPAGPTPGDSTPARAVPAVRPAAPGNPQTDAGVRSGTSRSGRTGNQEDQ